MGMPTDLPVIDLMLSCPASANSEEFYDFIKPLLMDEESRQMFKMPAEYMFKDIPKIDGVQDFVQYTVDQMDKHNIQIAMTGVDEAWEKSLEAIERFPDRFVGSYEANPNKGMDEVRKIVRMHEKYGIKGVTAFASGLCPQVPYNDKKWYPIYAKCVELDIPFCPCIGVPGPRIPMEPQKVEHLDEVCWFFPELKVVMRHGAEPWEKLAWKLMLKYPNLYYMTSAFAPSHYPEEIIKFANSRGSNKIMYAGYFPMGLSLERIFGDMPKVPFKDEVWPKFLRENAKRVFKIEA